MVDYPCTEVGQPLAMRSLTEMPQVLGRILEEIEDLGYTAKERFGIRLAVEEALVNAVKHGNRGDSAKTVQIRYEVSEEQFTIEIEDEGCGFQLQEMADPLAPENLDRPGGRGVLLMEYYMTWVQYHDAGNRVTMCWIRS